MASATMQAKFLKTGVHKNINTVLCTLAQIYSTLMCNTYTSVALNRGTCTPLGYLKDVVGVLNNPETKSV